MLPFSAQATVSVPRVALGLVKINLQFVPLKQKPNYTKEVLEPLHAKEAKEASDLAAQEAAQAVADALVAQQAADTQQAVQQPYVSSGVNYGNLYTQGQCTWYVASRISVPSTMGDATNWESGLLAAGWHYGLGAGSIGVSHLGWAGHVVVVDNVAADGTITISEMNGLLGPFNVDTRIAGSNEFIWLHQ